MNQLVTTVRSRVDTCSAHANQWHAFAAAWLGAFFDGFDATIFVMVLVPALSELLGTGDNATIGRYGSYVLAAFMTGWAVGAVIFGLLADRIGRAKTMMITILTYAFCTGLCALAHSWQELALYRFLVGCGIGGEIGISGIIVAETWRGSSRYQAMGVMVSAFGFGYLATSLLNLCCGSMGWRYLFFVGITPALLTFYVRAKLKDTEEFGFICEARKRASRKAFSERTDGEHALLKNPFLELFSVKNRHSTLIVATMASSCIMGYWSVQSWIPAWINQITGTAAVAERSYVTICMNLGLIACAFVGGKLVEKFGRSRCFFFGSLASFLCCLGMFTTVKSFGLPLLLWAFAIGAVSILPFVVLFIYVPELYETRIRGTAFGFSYNSGRLFAAVAAIFGGQIIANFGGSYSIGAASLSSVYLIGVIASFFMPETNSNVQQFTDLEASSPALSEATVSHSPALV
ncbi:MAG: MFS transporter [Leptolyngbya sp.]|nr:MFS transporter [Candidatus Melainabacteria bacterium]